MDAIAILSFGLAVVGVAGGAVYGYGRLSAKVDAMDQRHTIDMSHVNAKLDAKTDNAQFESLHADVREIRDMLLRLSQRPDYCPHGGSGTGPCS